MKLPAESRDELPRVSYRLPDLSIGRATGRDPLASYSWAELREIIYERPLALR